MNDITIDKNAALQVLRKNREAHRAIFLEACEGYKSKALELLENHVAEIKAGKLVRISVALPFPEDHTKDYDRVIRMLDMSINAGIEIDENTFASYIMDDWAWKRQFLHSNSGYSGTAALALQSL